jgi:hypothetical protein
MNSLAPTFTGLAAIDQVVVSLRDAARALGGHRSAARHEASIVAPHVDRSAAPTDSLGVYLAAIPFLNGDAWEVVR